MENMKETVSTALIAAVAIAAFAWAAHGDAKTHRAIRDWCIEASYLGAPVMPADVYECAEYGVALDNVITE